MECVGFFIPWPMFLSILRLTRPFTRFVQMSNIHKLRSKDLQINLFRFFSLDVIRILLCRVLIKELMTNSYGFVIASSQSTKEKQKLRGEY